MDVGSTHDFIWIGSDLIFEVTSHTRNPVTVNCGLLQVGIALSVSFDRLKKVSIFNISESLT